jgi:class III poly(R)-hydroxyalkanoic acid synthase PhaE subunit
MTADRQENSLVPGLDELFEAWTTALQTSEAGGGPVELATRLLDPRNWLGVGGAALEQPFETVLGLPRLADVPDLDRKLLNLLQSWVGIAQRGAEYSAMVSRVWMAAYGDFLPTLQAAALTGKPAASGRELLDRWTAMVNERLLKAQRSDEFLEVQRRLLDALLKSRAAEHELVEIGAKAADLPTRAEIDDVHKTLHAVKRELRALQRRLAAAEEAASDGKLKRGPA